MSKKEMTTEKRLKVRLYLSLLVYTVVGYIVSHGRRVLPTVL